VRALSLLLSALTTGGAARAQAVVAAPAPPSAPSAPSAPAQPEVAGEAKPATPENPVTPASPATAAQQRIEVTGGRADDTTQRQRSTAAKIVIGREEIDKFGDATLGEVLRRLPGVTTPGAPGRGGPPRLRGLGGGYTQILIDGQRTPPGFSVESLTPEQIERIEILRAPTAETGARAIAGTINIITREGFRRRLNDLRVGVGLENGTVSPGINWTHNNAKGPLTYNISGSVFRGHRKDESTAQTREEDVPSGATLREQIESAFTDNRRTGANLSGRLSWRLSEGGDSLALMPTLFHTVADNRRLPHRQRLHQRAAEPDVAPAPGRLAPGAQRRPGGLAGARRHAAPGVHGGRRQHARAHRRRHVAHAPAIGQSQRQAVHAAGQPAGHRPLYRPGQRHRGRAQPGHRHRA
jgi:iron complex outermembrane receptor protein